jgi:hypothetical protein
MISQTGKNANPRRMIVYAGFASPQAGADKIDLTYRL